MKTVIKFETLLVNENGQESWCASELIFASEDDPEFISQYYVLRRLGDDHLVRDIEVVERKESDWLT